MGTAIVPDPIAALRFAVFDVCVPSRDRAVRVRSFLGKRDVVGAEETLALIHDFDAAPDVDAALAEGVISLAGTPLQNREPDSSRSIRGVARRRRRDSRGVG